jgi:methylmalonyl-CoA mutase N-terminal domain/subunit
MSNRGQTAVPSAGPNDGRVPIAPEYPAESVASSSAIDAWRKDRLASGGPFRPRFMVYSGLGTPEMTAGRLEVLQQVGAESFLLAADLPSQLGFDPDHELAYAQVGRAGVSCTTLDDFRVICSRLDLTRADSVGLLANSVGHIGMGMVASVLQERQAADVKLVMQNDPLKEFTARGTEIHEPEESVRIACDCVAYAIDNDIPGAALTVCSNHYDVAGAGPILAMALAFANAIAYVDELAGRGYDVAQVCEKLMFFLNERSDFFVEAAVFRSARTIWSDILSDRYDVPVRDQPVMRLMGYAHGLESSEEPLVNLPRVTLSVLASVMGGADYLCATGYDEALRIPSVDAAALALRTMQVVGNEHGAAATVDPLAGSAKLRDIEDYVQTTVGDELKRLSDEGGSVQAVKTGYIKQRIDENRGTREDQIAAGERIMVGHNAYASETHRDLFSGRSSGEIDFAHVEALAKEKITAHKAHRNGNAVKTALVEVALAAAGSDNLLPPTIEALQIGATAEEIVRSTREGFAQ